MNEQVRDREEKKKIKLELQCFLFHLPWVSQTPHRESAGSVSAGSQPVVFSQQILRLSRKTSVLYKTCT